MVTIGDYLLRNNEVLQEMLSHLEIQDLLKAADVTEEFKIASQRLLGKQAKFNFLAKNKEQEIVTFGPIKCETQLAIIVGKTFNLSPATVESLRAACVDGPLIYLLMDTEEVPCRREYSSVPERTDAFSLLFPKGGNVIFDVIDDVSSLNEHINGEHVNPLKGALIFANCENNRFVKQILRALPCSVPIAGGKYQAILSRSTVPNEKDRLILNEDPICLLIRASSRHPHNTDDVRCDVGMVNGISEDDMSLQFRAMKNNVGEINVNVEQRIALVFRCVGRSMLCNTERKLIREYFPDVTTFETFTLGEIIQNAEKPDRGKKHHDQVVRQQNEKGRATTLCSTQLASFSSLSKYLTFEDPSLINSRPQRYTN